VRTIKLLAQNLGMKVIAEGVETEGQLEVLRSLQCDYAQGFFFSPSVEASEAESFLAAGTSW
jgi:EAL domain-containing protein (putative c-di-GMP-specific phosphodiesterase class I)